MRNVSFVEGEYYHIYNRGVDKRNIFNDKEDLWRLFQSMREFNAVEPIGSIYENSFCKQDPEIEVQLGNSIPKLVEFVAYCLNPNHYHFILTPLIEGGIQKFMHKVGLGYTNYFNEKNDRSGALFQGRYKAVHVNKNNYLLHLCAYVNLNNRIKSEDKEVFDLSLSSHFEYLADSGDARISRDNFICDTKIVSDQFGKKDSYEQFAESSLIDILRRKRQEKELASLLLE